MTLARLLFVTVLSLGGGLLQAAESPADLGRRWMVYAQGLAGQGRHAEAGPAYDKALQLLPGDAAILRSRGQWRWQQGQREEALQDLRASLLADPSQAELAAWLKAQEDPSPSGATAGARASEPDEERFSEAQALLEGRDFQAVLQLYREAAPVSGQDPGWQRLRAEAHYGEGRFDEARQALGEARRLAPDDAALTGLEQRYYHGALASDQGGGAVWPPLWRSALLPGWGQAYNGQKRKAWVTGLVTVGLFVGTALTYVMADQALADYRALGANASAGDFDAAFGRADGMVLLNQAVGISFYAAYAYNLFDAGAQARPAATQALGPRVQVLALRF
jgi:tetratricopeptide (TPR) repeat protein